MIVYDSFIRFKRGRTIFVNGSKCKKCN